MYLEFLGLRDKPFSITADPSFLYLSRKNREALSHIFYRLPEPPPPRSVAQAFALTPMRSTRLGLFNQLNQFLLDETTKGHNVVLIIDEAQNLSLRLLEQIRMLSN